MNKALASMSISPVGIGWFNWGIKENQARIMIRSIINEKADVTFFVGNSPEGKIFTKALLSLNTEIAVRSHWGITSGDFENEINANMRQAQDLQFIQTKFSYIPPPASALSERVFAQAQRNDNSIVTQQDIKAPAGFIHAYDLTKIRIAAIEQAGLTCDVERDKRAIHHALEKLTTSVQGLIKRYKRPFNAKRGFDSHEALNVGDYSMASYGPRNQIILEQVATLDKAK
ncbi:MAG: hypothetical protein HRU25_03000 [Psychrobium sp.]|nr:hypothetical protein [Psychrobium sp.]